jgi:hypothetical protein
VVGLDANNIFCIICKSPESCPQVSFASLWTSSPICRSS